MNPDGDKQLNFQQFLRQKAPGGCVPVEDLDHFRGGNGSQEERTTIGTHVKQCVFCMNRLLELQELESLAKEQGWDNLPPRFVEEFEHRVAKKTRKPNPRFEWSKIHYWLTPRWTASSAVASATVAFLVFLGVGLKQSYDRSLIEEQAKRSALEQQLKQKEVEATQKAEEEKRSREVEQVRREKEEETRKLADEKAKQEAEAKRLAEENQRLRESMQASTRQQRVAPSSDPVDPEVAAMERERVRAEAQARREEATRRAELARERREEAAEARRVRRMEQELAEKEARLNRQAAPNPRLEQFRWENRRATHNINNYEKFARQRREEQSRREKERMMAPTDSGTGTLDSLTDMACKFWGNCDARFRSNNR